MGVDALSLLSAYFKHAITQIYKLPSDKGLLLQFGIAQTCSGKSKSVWHESSVFLLP